MTDFQFASRSDEDLVCTADPLSSDLGGGSYTATKPQFSSPTSTVSPTPAPPRYSSAATFPSPVATFDATTPAYLQPTGFGRLSSPAMCMSAPVGPAPFGAPSLYPQWPPPQQGSPLFLSTPEPADGATKKGAPAPAKEPAGSPSAKDSRTQPDKDGKGKEAKDSEPKDGKQAKPGKAGAKDEKRGAPGEESGKPDGQGKEGAPADPKAKAKAKGSIANAGTGEAAQEVVVLPPIDTVSPTFTRAPVRPLDRGESFRPAEPPAFRVSPRAGGKPEPPSPQRARALALFREAMAQTAKLHASLLALAEQATSSARGTEAELAAQAQNDLDHGLLTLRSGLDQARLDFDLRADGADNFIELRRMQTYAAITGAATAAFDALDALKKTADKKFEGLDSDRTKKGEEAVKAQGGVTGAGDAAASAVTGLKATAKKDHPINIEPMPSAINEAIDMRLPKRSDERAKTYGDESAAQGVQLSKTFKTMTDELAKNFPLIAKAIEDNAKSSTDSITKTRDAARGQLAKGAREMHGSVAQARARGHAALVEQHNTLRRQMIGSHRERAQRENGLAQQRAARGAGAALSAAKAQQEGANGLGEALGKEAARPPDDLAKVMTASAGGMLRQMAKAGPQQRERLDRGTKTGEDDAVAQSRTLARGLEASADQSAGQLRSASWSAADGLDDQVKQGVAPFDKIPEQVTAAQKATCPQAEKNYTALNGGDEKQPGAGWMITAAGQTIKDAIAGIGGKPDPANAAKAPGGDAKGPKEKPAEFQKRAQAIAGAPNTEEGIAALVTTANGDIPPRVENKVGPLYDALMATSTPVESVMAQLRGLTEQQGRALSDVYNTKKGRNLARDLRVELRKFFSSDYTNNQNITAALAYLRGDNVTAANAELKAAVYLWNDTGRAEKVMRALQPEQLEKLKEVHPETIADVSGDLGDGEKQIFDALKEIKPLDSIKDEGERELQRKENYRLLGVANSYGVKRDLDQALETKGEAGGDKAGDAVANSYQFAGSDTLSGGDGPYEDPDVAEERRKAIWQETNNSFDKAAPTLPDGSPNVEAKVGPKLGAIARYAAAARTRTEFVPDDSENGGHFERVTTGLDLRQAQLIDDIARTGPNSVDTAASTIDFETNRKEGRPREDRLRKALLGDDLMGAREGESDTDRVKRLKERRDPKDNLVGDEARVKARKQEVLKKVAERRAAGQRTADDKPVEALPPDKVQKQITDQLDLRFVGDPSGGAYAKSMIESDTFEPDPKKAFDFALAHDERNKETLKATTERMNRDQIKDAVAEWDKGKPESDRLYSRLGLYRKSGKLEGDARNETELSFRGKPRNEKEKALNAIFVVEQQDRDSTGTGQHLARGDYDRMMAEQATVLRYLGVTRDQIDETGDIKLGPDKKEIRGNFDPATGKIKFADGEIGTKQRADFETAIRFSHMNAESYKQAVDRISQGIVMALVVAAAIITTFVTFGGAAAIWGPILITAAAGFAGMGMTALIRGDRYTSAEMQRDFVMTLVQAATAGLGAGLGAAAKGAGAAGKGAAALEKGAETAAKGAGAAGKGAAALEKGAETAAKAAAGGEKLAAGAAGAASKEGLSFGAKALEFGKDVVIGGTTNSINSFAAAAMDPENRRQGKSLDKGIDGGIKGFLAGSLGAAVTKPFQALGRSFGKAGERMAGNVGSGFTQRLAEARIGQAMGDPHQSWAESIEQAKEGIAQDAIQAFGEHHAEGLAERRAARKAAARPPARTEEPRTGPAVRPPGEAPHPEAPSQRPVQAADEAEAARARAVQEALPPDVRPVADEAAARARPPAANDNEPGGLPARRAVGDEEFAPPTLPYDAPSTAPHPRSEEPAQPARRRSEEDLELRAAGHDDDPPSTKRRTGEIPAQEGPRTLQDHFDDPDPRPPPIFVTADITADMLKGRPSIPRYSEFTASNPHSPDAARANYEALRGADPHREVLLARCVDPNHPDYGKYKVFQGGEHSVSRPPAGWITERHSHPWLITGDQAALLTRSLPSGKGADFEVLRREVDMMAGLVNSTKASRESKIDIRLGDNHHETTFKVTRDGDKYEYTFSVHPPINGVGERGPFRNLDGYEKWAQKETNKHFAKGGESYGTLEGATPKRAVHGEPISPPMRQDLDFIAGRMALAGEVGGPTAGARPHTELDNAVTRASAMSDARQRIVGMGLVGEPDSMIRLHNILNDDTIPVQVRAMISDLTLAETRNHLLKTGELAPGEPLIMLFHGATPERTQSLVTNGIDMARGPGGPHDDFGQGLYFTRSFETALKYRDTRTSTAGEAGQGGVIPYLLRGRDVGHSIDVSTGGKMRGEWENFAVKNAMTLLHGGDMMMTPAVQQILTGKVTSFSDFDASLHQNRGTLFNDFLASVGSHPSVIFGDLGGPLTHGIQLREVTDQVVIRGQEVADILNQQHVRPATGDADVPRAGGDDELSMRTAGPVEQTATKPPAPVSKQGGEGEGPTGMVLAPIERLDDAQLENRVNNALDAIAPGRKPPVPEGMSEGSVSAKDPTVAAAEQVRGQAKVADVVADFAQRRPEDAGRLLELLLVGGEPMARALRAETEAGMARALGALPNELGKRLSLTPEQRTELIDLMRARAAIEAPKQAPGARDKRIRKQVERWEKSGLSPGDIKRFLDAANGLRGHGEVGFATPARRAQDVEDFRLRPAVDAALAAEAGTIRGAKTLRDILGKTKEGWLLRFAHEGMLARGDAEPPLIERWHAYLDSVSPPKKVSREGFEKFARGHMKRVERAAFSELEAAFALGGRKPQFAFSTDPVFDRRLDILKCAIDPETGQNNPTVGGTDLIGYRRNDDRIVVGDDKAWVSSKHNNGVIDEVGAFFPGKEQAKANPRAGLIQNLADDAKAMNALFAKQQAKGAVVDAQHLTVPGRLERASQALEKAFPKGLVLTKKNLPKVKRILRQHGIELLVTSMAGRDMTAVSEKLRKAGVIYRRGPIIFPDPEEDE